VGIPGSQPKIEPQGKVRIGEQRTSAKGKNYPAGVDYFRSDSPRFAEVVGERPSTIRIRLVHDTTDEAFSTGLEWWIRDKNKKSMLACYTKDAGENPVALRMAGMLDPGQVPLSDEIVGNQKLRIACPARACPHMKKKNGKPPECKPMGRLVFVLDGDPIARVWQLDTKAWTSIEAIAGQLRVAEALGPLTGRLFELTVRFESKGSDRFPVITIQEIRDACPQTGAAVAGAESAIASEQTEGDARAKLIAAIRAREQDPKDPRVVEWVQKVGVKKALEKLTVGNAA